MDKEQSIPVPQGNKDTALNRLMTFKKPTPSPVLIKCLVPINRWLFLGGIPVLRALPFIGDIPGIRGLTNIPKLDFPIADEDRLREAVSSENACFMVPNHPEFFTDWMLDKEIMSRVAQKAASWATHDIVNGMGKGAQKFWLKNNLIAQIPGAGGAAGKAYSVECALAGNGVLLHPEGAVGWHGDTIGKIYPGAVDMAMQAARKADKNRRVFLAPIIWKLKFNRDVEFRLHKEMDYVEKSLTLPTTKHTEDLALRLYKACNSILATQAKKYDVTLSEGHFFDRQDQLIAKLLPKLDQQLDKLSADPAVSPEISDLIRRGERWLYTVDKKTEGAQPIKTLTRDLRLLLRFSKDFYTQSEITQEQIAESIKRIRSDYCKGTLRDTLNSFMPQPAGPRTAHIRVAEPLEITSDMQVEDIPDLLDQLRGLLQSKIDEINTDLEMQGGTVKYKNVFLPTGG